MSKQKNNASLPKKPLMANSHIMGWVEPIKLLLLENTTMDAGEVLLRGAAT